MKDIVISPTKIEPSMRPIEIVERKGVGHPDTLSDALGEHLSRTYSNYTRTRFGAILRHQFDKVALMCGRAKVSFGAGEMVEPIRVLINGRASACLGDEEIPVRDLLTDATREFFTSRFPMLEFNRDFRVMYEVRSGMHTTTGGIFEPTNEVRSATASIHYRFHPRSLAHGLIRRITTPRHHLGNLKEIARIAALQAAFDVQSGRADEWPEVVELHARR